MTAEPNHGAGLEWVRTPSPAERAAEIAQHEREVVRDVRGAFVSTLSWCALWLLIGLVSMAWALHTTDAQLGGVAFLGGLVVGYAGITTTLARYYLRGERSGWW